MDERPITEVSGGSGSGERTERELAERQARQQARGLAVSAAVLLVLGGIFLALGARDAAREGDLSEEGARTEAIVVEVREGTGRFGDPHARARFAVADGGPIEAEFPITETAEAELAPGERIEVIYDPANPARARPVDGWSRPSESKYVIGGTGILIAILLAFGAQSRHHRAQLIARGEIDLGPPPPEEHRRGAVLADPGPALETDPSPALEKGPEPPTVPAGVDPLPLPATVRSPAASLGRGLLVAAAAGAVAGYAITFAFLAIGVIASHDLFSASEDGVPAVVLAAAGAFGLVVARGLRIALRVDPTGLEVRDYKDTRRLPWGEIEELLVADPMPDRLGGPTVGLRTAGEIIAPAATALLPRTRRWSLAAALVDEARARGIAVSRSAIVAGYSGSGASAPAAPTAPAPPPPAPRRTAAPPRWPPARPKAPPPGPSMGWRLAHSLWIVWTLGLGFTSWISFAYVGLRAGRRKWLLAAALYLAGAAALVAYTVAWERTDGDVPRWLLAVAATLMFGLPVVTLIHALLIRGEYLRWLAAREEK